MTMGLTLRQSACAGFLHSYFDEHGYMPTYREIGAHMGLASVSGVYRLMHGLQSRGVIVLPGVKGRAAERGARFVEPRCPHCTHPIGSAACLAEAHAAAMRKRLILETPRKTAHPTAAPSPSQAPAAVGFSSREVAA